MIKQGFTPVEMTGTKKVIIASLLSKGVPSNIADFPLNGENVTGFTKDHVFHPGSTIYDSENAELYMLQEDYTWKKQ